MPHTILPFEMNEAKAVTIIIAPEEKFSPLINAGIAIVEPILHWQAAISAVLCLCSPSPILELELVVQLA
jgi:hypothetical protein